MKTTRATIPSAVKEQADFKYLSLEPKDTRELACWYEYSRLSDEVKELIQRCRAEDYFPAKGPFRMDTILKDQLGRDVFHIRNVIPIQVLCFLVECAGFPEKPFACSERDAFLARHCTKEVLLKEPVDVSEIPYRNLRQFIRLFDFERSFPAVVPRAEVVTIDWTYSNAEIAASFARSISNLRPPQFPEPPRAGQNGRRIGAGALVKLNQLAAYRLESDGYGFDAGRELTEFTTIEGWKKAVRTAKKRIDSMTKVPILSIRSL